MVQYRYRYYEKADGTAPVRDFIGGLPQKDKVKFLWTIEKHLLVFGPNTSDAILHKVGDFSQITFGNYRVLCVMSGNQYVLLHAFRKKSQSTKTADINRAKSHLRDMQDRGSI